MSLGEAEAARQLAALRAKKAGAGRRILAIDPGTAATGVALWEDAKLVFVDVVRVSGSHAKDRLPEMCQRVVRAMGSLAPEACSDIAIEWQMIRPDDPRPNDILNLSMVVGACLTVRGGTFTKIHLPLPVQWKGSMDGDIFDARVREHMPDAERIMIERKVPESQRHNGLDAAALAFWAIGGRLPWQAR